MLDKSDISNKFKSLISNSQRVYRGILKGIKKDRRKLLKKIRRFPLYAMAVSASLIHLAKTELPDILKRQLSVIRTFVSTNIERLRSADIRSCCIEGLTVIWAKIIEYTNGVLEKTAKMAEKFSYETLTAVSMVLLFLFVLAAVAGSNISYGYKVIAAGTTVGFCETKEIAERAAERASDELRKINANAEITADEVKIVFAIANKNFLQSEDYVENSLVAAYDERADAYGIYVDNEFIVAMNTNEEAQEILDGYLEEYSDDDKNAYFNKDVQIRALRINQELISTGDKALEILKTPKGGITKYTVEEGDTMYAVAQKFGMTFQKVAELNSNITPERMQIGQEIIVSDITPLLAVRTSEQSTELEAIDFQVVSIKDETQYQGINVVSKNGEKGEKEVNYNIIKENGVVVEKIATSEKVIKEPVAEEVKTGVKERPRTMPTGKFTLPYYGTITSRFGSRSRGYHTGVDYGGRTGDPIRAADGGTVSFAGWSGSYGYLVKINHGNGYETYYAHLSAISVSAGQKVAKRETIGKLGNTGNSTGPHVHFEIRKDGVPLNPLSFKFD